jgi:hypothetical protein
MKKIERIYTVITENGDEEGICAIGTGMSMQCASSNKDVILMSLQQLRLSAPNKTFKIVSFVREE